MTIGLTDLLRRTRPFVLISVPLLAACSHDDGERLAAFVQGNPPPPIDTQYAALAMTVEDVSSVEPAAVVEQVAVSSEEASAVEEVATAHQVCEPDWVWRGTIQPGACHTEYW